MRRFFVLALLAAGVMAFAGTARAQVTADQLNKLSLEALTAPPPRSAYRPSYSARQSYSYHASYAAPRAARWHGRSYARGSVRYGRVYAQSRHGRVYAAARHGYGRAYAEARPHGLRRAYRRIYAVEHRTYPARYAPARVHFAAARAHVVHHATAPRRRATYAYALPPGHTRRY